MRSRPRALPQPARRLPWRRPLRKRGVRPAPATSLRFHLSESTAADTASTVLAGTIVPAVLSGARVAGVGPGSYYVGGVVDDLRQAIETQEDNDGRYWPLAVY